MTERPSPSKQVTRKQYATNAQLAFGEEQRAVLTRGLFAFVISAIALAAISLILAELLNLPSDTVGGLGIAAQASVVPGLWLLFAIRQVSRFRFLSKEDIQGSAYTKPSRAIAPRIAFLQNTLEQSVLLVIANLVVSSLGTEQAVSYVLGSAAMFTVGRVLFWIGYEGGAKSRAFGMVMTMTPAIGGFAFWCSAVAWRGFNMFG